MKKSLFIILMVCLALVGFVSCKNEIEPVQEELVSISFEEGASRALTSTLEDFNKGAYYWKYAAKKADTSNLISGQTANYDVVDPTETSNREAGAQWVNEGHAGLGSGSGTSSDPYVPYKVQGFSQGLWDFTLYAYKKTVEDNPSTTDVDESVYTLVYQGETTGFLLKAGGLESSHKVSVVVSPVKEGNGTLSVLITGENKIKLNPATPLPQEVMANAKIKLKIERIEGSTTTVVFPQTDESPFVDSDYNESLDPGTYKVSVEFTNDDGAVVYASGSVVSTVYSGLTTTVSGSLSEVVTYIEFDAEQNPDIVTTTAGVDGISVATQGDTSGNIELTEPASVQDKRVTATMPVTTAKSLIAKLEEELGSKTSVDPTIDPDAYKSSLDLNLSVNTTDATETTITYEIGMEATLTYEKIGAASGDKTETTSTVETLDDFVTIQIELQRGLTDVRVKHTDDYMTACESLDDLNSKVIPGPEASEEAKAEARKGYYFYQDPYIENNVASTTKSMLYIRTYKFSPFQLSYTIPDAVAAIGSKTYTSLEEAVAAVPTDGTETTITMINDTVISGNAGVTIPATKNVVLDLNGYTVKNAVNQDATSQVIANNGKLVIKDSSDTAKNGTGTGLLTNSVDEGTHGGEWWSEPQRNYVTTVINNFGDLTVESGRIQSAAYGSICYAIDNNSGTRNAKLTVNGGLLTSIGTVVRLFCNSVTFDNAFIIHGGKIVTDGSAAFWIQLPGSSSASMKRASLLIDGGTISGSEYAFYDYSFGDGWDNVRYEITGGYFEGWIYSYNEGYTFITGGTYTKDPSDYVAGGYVAVPDDEENPTLWNIETIEERFAELAEAKNLTILTEVLTETFDPQGPVNKKGMACVDCISKDSNNLANYRLYVDGKLYLNGFQKGFSETEYTVSGVDGILGWWNYTVKKLIIDCNLEQAYGRFKNNPTITQVTFTNKVTSIPAYMFNQGTSITEVTIPESVETIEIFAFRGCNKLTKFTVDGSNTSSSILLKEDCIRECTSLSTIDIKRPAVIGNYVGRSCSSLSTVYLRSADTTFTGTSQVFNHQDSGQNAGVTVYVANEAVKTALKAASSSSLDEWIIIIQ